MNTLTASYHIFTKLANGKYLKIQLINPLFYYTIITDGYANERSYFHTINKKDLGGLTVWSDHATDKN
jgi:hypothetical protein